MHQILRSNLFTNSQSAILLCFSHLRWNFVFQRPQHLLTRASSTHNIIYFEEPEFQQTASATMRISAPTAGIRVVTPILPQQTNAAAAVDMQRQLVDELLLGVGQYERLVTWYYTPMALSFSGHLPADVCVYDCMDELSAFKDPPAGLADMERALFATADLVFTGGESLYAAKRKCHPRVYPFPSSIDAPHFNKARKQIDDPADQAGIPYPRIGFFGVIDERMDLALVAQVADELPHCHFVMLGPVVKIDVKSIPQAPNLHWLGGKSYDDLPKYLANWNAGWMPFALNESTRYISPTKTPEFLSAGLPVVSTAIADVMRPYGTKGLVEIAAPSDMARKLVTLLSGIDDSWLARTDAFLSGMSWDWTWQSMLAHIARVHALNDATLMRRGA
jgi:glycosyltransferase involved in cell wall biosynthesis